MSTIDAMLGLSTCSMLLVEQRANQTFAVGVPHHAPAGTSELPCPEHRAADENAGFLGRYIAEALGCSSVIACNYRIDSNKSCSSDYTLQIERWKPRVLVEIHGHGGKSTKHDIEISSGATKNDSHSESLARKLENVFSNHPDLRSTTVCGTFDRLFFKASSSVTITDERWIAYHIELPPTLRKASGGQGLPPKAGYAFCDVLVQALKEIHGPKP